MDKVLIITPHLSTGGLPQYLFKKIQKLSNETEFWVIEWDDITGGVFIIQRTKIKNLLNERLITLGSDKNQVFDYIEQIRPDVIHFEELPETFVATDILDRIYNQERSYKITCTTHSSFTNPASLKYLADKFILVSEWSKNKFSEHFKGSIPCDIWEYPIERVKYDKNEAKRLLDFDPEYKHVLHVGLFTPGKNQGHVVELAKLLRKHKIIFHFVGNQADNFKEYWQPIMADFPDNCIWHGERSDVNLFYQAADVFYFPSLFELNPLAVKEAQSHSLPIFMRNLETCKPEGSILITDNIQVNRNILLEHFGSSVEHDVVTIVLSHANTEYRKGLLKECLKSIRTPVILSTNYPAETDEQELSDWVLYDKDNPLLYLEEFNKHNVLFFSWKLNDKGERIVNEYFKFEHSYAVYKLIQNGLRLVKALGKNKVQIINYDYIIHQQTQEINIKHLDEHDIVFYENNPGYYDGINCSYCTGYFLGKTDTLLKYFEYYKNRAHFYQEDKNIFEIKTYNYFAKNPENILEIDFEILKNNQAIDKEGVDSFSKNNTQNSTRSDHSIYIHSSYIEGPTIEIECEDQHDFEIQFKDKSDNILYMSTIKSGMWSRLNSTYYRDVKAEIRKDGQIIHTELFEFKDKRVLIILDSKSLGDTLAWIPYAEEFRKKHNCKVLISTFLNDIFRDQYPELEFIEQGSKVENLFAVFRIGWYNEDRKPNLNKNPQDFKKIPLQQTASDILGLEYKEVKPLLKLPAITKKKKVGLGIHSTAQAKYWNNPTGWQEVADYLKDQGYEVVLYSREPDGYMGNKNPQCTTQFTGDLQDIINDIAECEYFIGIGSGLSWLAWAAGLPVFLISGFSEDYAEMQNCIRIINKSVCNGCFNRHWFDPGDWNWCPEHKNTERHFECTKSITGQMVIEKIKEFHKQNK